MVPGTAESNPWPSPPPLETSPRPIGTEAIGPPFFKLIAYGDVGLPLSAEEKSRRRDDQKEALESGSESPSSACRHTESGGTTP